MIQRTLIVLFLCLLFGFTINGQGHREQFKKHFKDGDLERQHAVLLKWEKAAPDDPELYVSWFNYYFRKSSKETLSITSTPKTSESIAVRKEGEETVVGYIGTDVYYAKADFDLGIVSIDKGISKFPNRLDMRFGKTHALAQIKDYQKFTDEIVKAIDHSRVNNNQWLWGENKPVEDPKKFLLGSVQTYVVQLFDAGDKEAQFIKPIAESVLRIYPEHVESLSNLSLVYMLNGDYDSALTTLLKAEKLANDDYVIVANIAYGYYNKRDKINATKYYERLAKIGDGRAKADAEAKLSEIKSWK